MVPSRMEALKRSLYLEAAVWAVAGLSLAVAPRFVLQTVFRQPPYPDEAWVRVAGVQAVGLAMFMVLVAHRIEQLWWWTWGFCFVTVGIAATTLLNAAFGLAPGEPAAFWWIFAGVTTAFALWLLYGLARTARQVPID
jgi:hypothetical protein